MSPIGPWLTIIPSWVQPIILFGLIGFFIYEGVKGLKEVLKAAIKASEHVARAFGSYGQQVRERADLPGQTLAKIEQIQDNLEMQTAYLIDDAAYHAEADVVVAERCPGVVRMLPRRVPFSEFKRRWQVGWRPDSWTTVGG